MSKTNNPRLPPGQTLTEQLPVLHIGDIPAFDIDTWTFRIFGLVENEIEMKYERFLALPHETIIADFHCVTTWSRFDNVWEGVKTGKIAELARVKPSAKFVMVHCKQGYTTNIRIEEFFEEDVIFARKLDGADLTPEHGFPLRLVVPRLYAWKSAKWVRAVEFMELDSGGFWELRGYHNHGDPWKEERYGTLFKS